LHICSNLYWNKSDTYCSGTRSLGAYCALPPITPFNQFSNCVLHMQIDAAVSEIQRLVHSAIVIGCTKIVVCIDFEYVFTIAF